MSTQFVHLHNHSEFSLLDGASKIKDMIKYAVDNEMPAIALTDHGVMYGAFEFWQAAKKAGINGIVGVEAYVAPKGRKHRAPTKDGEKLNHHLVLLAKNQTGYKNLMKLTTLASLEGFYYKPRIDRELLAEYHEGIIACSACLGGELAQNLINNPGTLEIAKNTAAWYRELFGEDFYLEVQGHGASVQDTVNEKIIQIARQMGIKLVATNDAHYTRKEDAHAHDVLICIQTGTTVHDTNRMKYEPQEFYLKPYKEMFAKFEKIAPDAIGNTLEIHEKCNLTIETGRAPMPVVGLIDGKNADESMEQLCWEGLERRLPRHSQMHRDRLTYELGIIKQMGFSQYFLIVRDISQYARTGGIYFGVRGSAAGSLASYCLGITDLDPVEYNLTFERFLNPERVSMPDIDMDFEDTRRADVIRHVTEFYGADKVSYITTFGTMGAKAAIRDAGRALALPLSEVDRIAKMIPSMPLGVSIDKAMHGWPDKDYPGNPELRAEYENNETARLLIDTARRIEGVTRNESVHAAGIMISDRPLVEYTPLRRLADGSVATQYPHSSLEAIGLLKMDFLGLINLTILSRSVKLIKERRNIDVDVWQIPLFANDPDPERATQAKRAYDMLGRGETVGIFQLESAGMRKYIVELKPNSVKELAAMVALYRPGPLAHIPRFIRSKFDPAQITYTHEWLKPILSETYGVIVYQDQVLKIVQAIAGFSLGQADLLRRAMSKKKKEDMDKMRSKFLEGAKSKGVSEKIAEAIFEEIEPFTGYAFNGCLSAKTFVTRSDGTRLHISAAYREQTPELMAMWEDGVIRPHRVKRIVHTGRKPLFEIRTKGKRVVRATAEHRFLTTEGYKPVQELHPGVELIVQPRPASPAQRVARRHNAVVAGRSKASRQAVSQRMKEYQAARPYEEKAAHMEKMHREHPELWKKGQEAATKQQVYLHKNDPKWRKEFLTKTLANVRAAYDTGPGYGHCSIASNGMWCASTPERAMCEWLIEQNVEFEMHKVLPNGRMCDFYFAGIYWEMDGMDRVADYFTEKYGEMPYVVVTPEDFRTVVSRHLQLCHAENGDPIVSIMPCGEGETYDIEMMEDGPKNFIANRIVSHNSHAACYAMVAYQTAFLKANYSAEYMAALLGAYIDNTEKVVNTLEECARMHLDVLPPDVNLSGADFTVEGDSTIRFGLSAIKNVGKAPVDAILAAREKGGPFVSLEDFCMRIFAEGATSRTVVEMLIKAGALHSIHPNRRALLETVENCVNAATRGAKDAAAGFISLFGDAAPEDAVGVKAVAQVPEIPDFSRGERLALEKELLGLYLSEHPVKPFEPELRKKFKARRCDSLKETQPNENVIMGGLITNVRTSYTKAGQAMLFVTLEDTSGAVSATCFPKAASEWGKYLLQNSVVVIYGKAQHRERINKQTESEDVEEKSAQVELIVDRVDRVVENAMAADARPREVHVRVDDNNRSALRMVREAFAFKPGGSPLFFHLETPNGPCKIRTRLEVDNDETLLNQVRQMLGGGQRRVWVE